MAQSGAWAYGVGGFCLVLPAVAMDSRIQPRNWQLPPGCIRVARADGYVWHPVCSRYVSVPYGVPEGACGADHSLLPGIHRSRSVGRSEYALPTSSDYLSSLSLNGGCMGQVIPLVRSGRLLDDARAWLDAYSDAYGWVPYTRSEFEAEACKLASELPPPQLIVAQSALR